MTNQRPPVPTYVYVTYIRANVEQVWQALPDAELTARYWGHAIFTFESPDAPVCPLQRVAVGLRGARALVVRGVVALPSPYGAMTVRVTDSACATPRPCDVGQTR